MKTVISMIAVAAFTGSAMAQGGTSFAGATNWAGAQTVTGAFSAAVSSEALIFAQDYSIATGSSVASFTVNGLQAGANYRAVTSAAAGGGSYDTRLRTRNSSGTTLGENDDFSGLFSRVIGTVPGDGTLEVQGTYWTNSAWGAATAITAGRFNMALYAVTVTTPGVSTQWYRFSGLGGSLQAEIMSATGVTDTVMAAFDSSGSLIASDDDGGAGLFSYINGPSVPGDGVVYLAVTYFRGGDQNNSAFYANENGFTGAGQFELRVVPTPGSLALLGLGGLMAARRRR